MSSRFFAAALLAAFAASFASPVSAAVIVITQAKAAAGNVTPGDPPGFPVILSQPGSYRFNSNLTVPAGRNGLHVTSHYVNIDMNGFRLWGWNAAGDTRVANNGVYSSFGTGSIRNGTITGFRFDGVSLVGGSSGWTVENMNIQANGDDGIDSEGFYSRYLNNTVTLNGDIGITCGYFCHAEGNSSSDNGWIGIYMYSGTALGNTVFSNVSHGLYEALPSDMGFGNNTIVDNNGGAAQVSGGIALHPNACAPTAC